MKLWITKNSEVPVHDQLVAQITLGIASGDLRIGERLPSTRELARRFRIHQNTVSSAYRDLAGKGLVKFRKGSGVYIADKSSNTRRPSLDSLFSKFLNEATRLGYAKSEINLFVRNTLFAKPVKRFLVIESDTGLRKIIEHEIQAETGITTDGISLDEFSDGKLSLDTRVVAMMDEKSKVESLLPSGASPIFLNANSVPSTMSGQPLPADDDLIAVVSGWEKFITFARLYLLAAKIDRQSIIARSTVNRGWRKGIDQATMIICDTLTSQKFADDKRIRVFPLIAQSSRQQLLV